MSLQKYTTRLRPILGNAVNLFLPSMANMLLSAVVIYKTDSKLWGQIVIYQIFFYLVTAFINWGNKEYLLLNFSKNPSQITMLWQQSFVSRFWFLLLPSLVFTLLFFPIFIAINIVCWISLRFVIQSFESIWVFNKTYSHTILSEIIALSPILLVFVNGFQISEQSILILLTTMFLIRFGLITLSYRHLFEKITFFEADISVLKYSLSFMLLSLVGFLQTKSDLYCIGYFSEKSVIGKYQILTSVANLIYLLPGFLITPFTKHIYRLSTKSLRTLEYKLFVQGVFASAIHLVLSIWLMQFIYDLKFDNLTYGLLYMGMILPFLNIIPIHKIYRDNRQRYVFLVSFVGILINVICCTLLIPIWQINGAITANLCTSLFLFFAFRINYLKNISDKWKTQKAIWFYKKLIPSRSLCFDGGANIGKRSKILLKCGLRVVAIEPQPFCLPELEKLRTLFKNFTITSVALSNKKEQLTMFISNVSEVSTLSPEFIEAYQFQNQIQWNKQIQVSATTLDELILKYGKPYFCKLDIENYELQALQGLSEPIPLLSFEFNKPLIHNAINCAEYLSNLANYEFNVVYFEEFKLIHQRWVSFDELKLICVNMPKQILTGEFFARIKPNQI